MMIINTHLQSPVVGLREIGNFLYSTTDSEFKDKFNGKSNKIGNEKAA